MQTQRSNGQWFSLLRASAALGVFGISAGQAVGEAAMGLAGPAVAITNVLQLREAARPESTVLVSLRLEATVWWSSRSRGQLILCDDSCAALVEADFPCPIPGQGNLIRLAGDCTVLKARDVIKVSSVPLVENDGFHMAETRSGQAMLRAGYHPIRVGWFNRSGEFDLEVAYEGPGVPRQKIPDSVLFHSSVDPTIGISNFVNGLEYRCFEGMWWTELPDFNHLPPLKNGTSPGFDIAVRTRDAHQGIQFTGYIYVPRDGQYTFLTCSDDGSRLFMDEPSIEFATIGHADLSPPAQLQADITATPTQEFQRAEIEGTVSFVNHQADPLQVDLAFGLGTVRMFVAEIVGSSLALAPQSQIRAVGVSRAASSPGDGKTTREFFVQNLQDIKQIGPIPPVVEFSGSNGALPLLTTAEQVDKLSPVELSRAYPVKLRGVVTSVLPWNGMIMQDSTRGENVFIGSPNPLRAGDYCEVEGVTAAGDFSPYIIASQVKGLGPGPLPSPARPGMDQLLNGSMHAQFVELEGVVTLIVSNTITLLTREGRIKVNLEPLAPKLPMDYVNALIRLRGCMLNDWDKENQRINVGQIFIDPQGVSVIQPAPADPFAIPSRHVRDLLHFDPQAGALQRVKVTGQVVHRSRDVCYLQDGINGLRFIPAVTTTLSPGDVIDVVGFPEFGGPSPEIREAVVRLRTTTSLPEPLRLEPEDLIEDDYDSRLVGIEGVLTGLGNSEGRVRLDLMCGSQPFTAFLEPTETLTRQFPIGSRLFLTGVYVGLGGNRVLGQRIDSFQLLVNSPSDIRLLVLPPWWNLKRLLAVTGFLAGVLIMALAWIKLLHSRVAERTVQLEAQIQERQHAEQQREVEQERSRVANDLHDDLGARLTEVNMLTTLVKSPATTAEEKSRYLEELDDLARHMVGSLDEIVWAVNPRNDTIGSLASYFGAYAQRFLELASVACALDVAADLPHGILDSKFRHEVFLAFKEALNNVVRHSDATRVLLSISVQDHELQISVTDNGRGFDPERTSGGADGLANMRQRLSALGGQCRIHSENARGTTIRFQTPLPHNSYDQSWNSRGQQDIAGGI
jgi:signal transduction histidine kinase